jgi:UPF0755 protein
MKTSIIGKLHTGCAVALLIVATMLAAGMYEFERLTEPLSPGSTKSILVNIPHGTSSAQIGEILAKRGVIRSQRAFLFAAWLHPSTKALQSGYYELSPSMPPDKVLGVIEDGLISMNAVTFPEGWTVKQMADRLAKRGMVNEAQFLDLARNHGRSFTAPNGFVPPDDNLEGYLFPSTYRFDPNSDPRTVISEMLGMFEQEVVDKHSGVHSWHDTIIVASMVEREARVPEDRPLIAGVIDNRLRAGMRLQLDATVQYALPAHKARLMDSDLQVDSPYNTYRHPGLPPTPICCPGVPSIEAALDPTPSTYLFYVSGPGDKHIFTHNYAEHTAVIRKLRGGEMQ